MLTHSQQNARWGHCPELKNCCLADLNGDGVVDGGDLLILLGAWGQCPGFEELDDPPSLAELLKNAGLTDEQWSEFVSVMMNGTEPEKANYLCWMENYFALCDPCPTCPDSDPFGE
jgi:hypothetical protein